MVGADCFKKDLERKTFKQAVEEIVCQSICEPSGYIIQECNHRLKGQYCDFVAKFTDRILSAHNAELDRIAEGMPKPVGKSSCLEHISEMLTMDKQRRIDQAYIQAQKEGM
jgi:hypothetical protein